MALGLNKHGHNILYRFNPCSEAQILIGCTPVWKKGQFGSRQGQLLGQRNRLGSDLLLNFSEGMLNRHSSLDANQQKVESVATCAADRPPALTTGIADAARRG